MIIDTRTINSVLKLYMSKIRGKNAPGIITNNNCSRVQILTQLRVTIWTNYKLP